jgi:undecaprenyl-diphosphatase
MFLTEWLERMGLSLELVIIVGTVILALVFVLIHYWKRIMLFFAPWMGEYGKSLQQRWGKPAEGSEPGH